MYSSHLDAMRGIVISKQIVYDPLGTRYIKVEIVEERDVPSPIIMSDSPEVASIAREVMPLVTQIVRSMPFTGPNRITVPRVTLWLTDEEMESFGDLDVGDYVEMELGGGRLTLKKA